MRIPARTLLGVSLALLLGPLCGHPVQAQECTEPTPVAACVDPPVANAPIDPALPLNCVTPLICDLGINSWPMVGGLSPDISLGQKFVAGAPLFVYDPTQDRYCTKIYSRIHNQGGGAAAGGGDVTVAFAVKEAASASDYNNPMIPWQPLGTYTMVIPAAPGALLPFEDHEQQVGVCWHLAAGESLPEKLILRAEVSWAAELTAQQANNTAYTFIDRTAAGQGAQIALVLDLSGSMSSSLPTGGTRLSEAVDKATLFTLLVEPGNRLGVYGFATNNSANTSFSASYTGTDNLVHSGTYTDTAEIAPMTDVDTVPADVVPIATAIGGQTVSHGCTPVGQGLLRARANLGASLTDYPVKAIVLLSDGLQNVPPFVNTNTSSCVSGSPGVPISAEKTFGDEDIQIYSVFFGGSESGWGYNLMNQVKTQTGGDYIYGAEGSLALAAAYYSIRGLVDDMILFDGDGQTSLQGPWPTYTVRFDSAAGEATAAVAWPVGDGESRLTIDYRQAGETDWRTSEPIDRLPSTNVGMAVPTGSFHVVRFNPGPNTTWEIRVRQLAPREGSTPFAAAVFSPVRSARIRPWLDDDDFTVGDPLPIHVALDSGGAPVVGAAVEAVVDLPARPFSTTLRSYADRLTQSTQPPSPAPADANNQQVAAMAGQLQKLLAQETGSAELYPTRRVTVALSDDGSGVDTLAGDGIYSGALAASETEIAGPYEVTATAKITQPSGEVVERIAKLATVAAVGPADSAKSDVRVTLSPPRPDGSRLAVVSVLPTDRFGNAAFPGSSPDIQVTARGASLQGGVTGGLDTIFTQQVLLPPGATRADVQVSVGGVSVGSRPIGRPAFDRHEASFHLGVAIPQGSFGHFASNGPSLGLDYAYRFDEHFAVRTEADWNDFEDPAGDSLRLVNLTSFLQYRAATGRWVPYFEAGLGYYDLENAGSAGGFAVGAGLRTSLSRSWSLDLSAHAHHVDGSLDLAFSQVHAGVIFNF